MDDTAKVPTPEEAPQEDATPVEEPKEEKKDRTSEQFDKLTKTNQELKEERDSYKNLFESLRPAEVPEAPQQQYQEPINQAPAAQNFQNLDQNQVNDVFTGMIDENGYLDGNKLMNTLTEMDKNSKAGLEAAKRIEAEREAEKKAKRELEEKQGQKEVYDKYEMLNPESDTFDEQLWERVYNKLAVKAKRGELPSQVDYMKAADEEYEYKYGKGVEVTKEEKQTQEKNDNAKRVINATRPRSTLLKDYYAQDDDDNLMKAVREGKQGSVAEALRRLENPRE